ncbi:putative bifunctional diguanylate cyclase/phosphodiesterase [Azohydromonas lata]|uniref:putative bifunctional diguanylate cyclase/phosphodiesterase n=1 Tax=Azohydromonas lata TaxID=45677 RepID=UPI000834A4CB|nr:GGDEF domain-containing phosphodiesterase [Azohydromonas lata]
MNAPLPLGALLQAQEQALPDGQAPQWLAEEAEGEGMVVTDAGGRIQGVNDAFVAASGYAREELLGATPARWASGRHGREFYRALWASLHSLGHWSGEVWNRRADGTLVAERVRIAAVQGEGGAPAHYVAWYGRPAGHVAGSPAAGGGEPLHDPVTELPARALALQRLDELLEQARRQGHQVAVCHLSLDGWHDFVGWYGNAQGDALLLAAAARLRGCLRPGDTVARLCGGEFALLLGGLQGMAAVQATLQRVHQALQQPYALSTQVPRASASAGVAMWPAHGDSAQALLRAADAAMYRAQRLGQGVCLAGEALERPLEQEALLEELRMALFSDQLRLHWQPRVCARTRRLLGAEALLRWQHPRRGLLSPQDFLKAAAGTPLEVELDLWALRAAAVQRARWREAGREPAISLNVSPATLALPDLADTVACLLLEGGGGGHGGAGVELEVAETAVQDDLIAAARAVKACAKHGIGVALDGFGTGYASLATLRRLPVSALKIDRGFIGRMQHDQGDLQMVRAALGMAQAFNIRSVAVGVESETQAHGLAAWGCAELQGFYVAPPMGDREFEAWLAA